jgi:PilZ domain
MGQRDSDKRKNKRYAVEGISGNVLYTSDLEVLNISIDGAAIETSKRLELNREYTFKIKHRGSFLNLKGLIVWATLVSKMNKATGTITPVYRAGIRFTDTLSEKAKTLHQFIEDNKVTSLEQRLGGVRFQISTDETVKIDLPHEYKVKKISLSGMLVETSYPLELDSRNNIELFLNEHALQIIIRVANCKDITIDGITKYDIGIEFLEMSEQDEDILQNFLNTLEEG